MYCSGKTCRILLITFLYFSGVACTKLSPEPGGLCSSTVYKCDIRSEARRLTCAGTLHGIHAYLNPLHLKIRFLSLCKWYHNFFNPEILTLYQKIEKFTLSRSNIKHLVTDFPPLLKLKVIVMSGLGLEYLEVSTFYNVPHLRVLDIRSNCFTTLSSAMFEHLVELHQVFLAGKDYMCKDELIWVCEEIPGKKVMDKDEMYCGWKYPGLRVEPVMQILKRMNTQCPSNPPHNCMCLLDNAVETLPSSASIEEDTPSPPISSVPSPQSSNLIPLITVDCSYRKLNALPATLPDNTITVLAQGNQITDISLLLTNSYYSHILDLILDYNPIMSIDRLEGAMWLKHFRNLSLRGNKLSQLPTYALDNALEANPNVNLIHLGDNPWRCDCGFTPGFQEFLHKYEDFLEDSLGIRCAWSEDEAISLQPIRTLSKSLICSSDQTSVQPLLILNSILVLSLLFVVVKFCYDYIMYKKFGQLPWIITKIP